MDPHAIATRIGVAALAAATAGALALGAGRAHADGVYPLTSCLAPSPNIVDLPYNPTRVIVAEYAGDTYLTTEFNSVWVGMGYQSSMRLDYQNLRTGQRGSRFSTRNVSPPYTGTHVFTIRTSQLGRGPVRLVLATTNRNALISIPAPTCTTVITVR